MSVFDIPAGRSQDASRSIGAEVASYIAITFGFSWVMTVGAIKLGLGEEYLNIGTAGPAVAALILSRSGQPDGIGRSARRCVWFTGLLMACWIVLSLHYLWWNSDRLQFHLRPFLLIPSIVPALILSGVFAPDEGVRDLVQRLVHPLDCWSGFAVLYFPIILGVPSAIAYAFGAALVWPDLGGLKFAAIANATMFFLYNLLFVATQEEPGWRGFLLERLQSKFSPLWASLWVWLPWALWHAPLDYYRPVRFTLVQEVLLRVVFLIPLTIILTWFYNRSERSIQAVAIFHASMNTFPFVMPYCQPAWFVVFIFAAYAMVTGRMWRKVQ